MGMLALIVGLPYLAYLMVMAVLLGLTILLIGTQAAWMAARWLVLTLLYYALWPLAWIQQKLTA